MFSVSEFLFTRFKLQLLRGLKRYTIGQPDYECLSADRLFRCRIRIRDEKFSLAFEGMAEGSTKAVAKLLALAEAYERMCLNQYQVEKSCRIRTDLPYGLGVGLRKNSAFRRSWGEFYERLILGNASPGSPARSLVRETRLGKVFLYSLTSTSGQIGTGYGLSKRQAISSAQRSAIRKRDLHLQQTRFLVADGEPKSILITPAKQAWLECHLVGYIDAKD